MKTKIRNMIKPPTTWGFKKSTPYEKILCNTCIYKEIKNYCPLLNLSEIQRNSLIAIRCNFYLK